MQQAKPTANIDDASEIEKAKSYLWGYLNRANKELIFEHMNDEIVYDKISLEEILIGFRYIRR